jgi:mRNA deadenylase 3'-5' endonuclease subunit Ccr4
MSYNILADTLVRPGPHALQHCYSTIMLAADRQACLPAQAHEHAHELYRACPRWCLDWGTRGPGILAEIGHWDPDIGCLQEVDRLEQVQAHLEARGCAFCGP